MTVRTLRGPETSDGAVTSIIGSSHGSSAESRLDRFSNSIRVAQWSTQKPPQTLRRGEWIKRLPGTKWWMRKMSGKSTDDSFWRTEWIMDLKKPQKWKFRIQKPLHLLLTSDAGGLHYIQVETGSKTLRDRIKPHSHVVRRVNANASAGRGNIGYASFGWLHI